MNAQALVDNISSDIKEMGFRDLKTLSEFVEFLKEKELEEEILGNKNFIDRVKLSKKSWEKVRSPFKKEINRNFVDWDDIKKKYKI